MFAVPTKTMINKCMSLLAIYSLSVCVMAQAPQVGRTGTPLSSDAPSPAQINPNKKLSDEKKASWLELTPSQQRALAPLSQLWSALSEAQRKKWLALSKNFATLPESEQIIMHSRMAEWATLTPQQRIQARLNFGETNKMPQVEKKAQWEAYQALSDEEKRKLSDSQPPPVWGAAPAQRSVTSDKLSHVHSPPGLPPIKGKTPGVKDLDQKTLLPATKPVSSKLDVPAA